MIARAIVTRVARKLFRFCLHSGDLGDSLIELLVKEASHDGSDSEHQGKRHDEHPAAHNCEIVLGLTMGSSDSPHAGGSRIVSSHMLFHDSFSVIGFLSAVKSPVLKKTNAVAVPIDMGQSFPSL